MSETDSNQSKVVAQKENKPRPVVPPKPNRTSIQHHHKQSIGQSQGHSKGHIEGKGHGQGHKKNSNEKKEDNRQLGGQGVQNVRALSTPCVSRQASVLSTLSSITTVSALSAVSSLSTLDRVGYPRQGRTPHSNDKMQQLHISLDQLSLQQQQVS